MSKILFCESDGFWATKFRQIVPDYHRFKIEEVRIISQLSEILSQASRSIVAIEITGENIDEISELLCEFDSGGGMRWVALIERDLVSCSPHLRSLGFIEVISSPLALKQLALLTQQHLSLLPEQERSLRESIIDRLPWKNHANLDH